MTHDKLISTHDLHSRGFMSLDEARAITGGQDSIRFDDLVKHDGLIALKTLSEEEIGKIFEELYRAGLPTDAPKNAFVIANLVWTLAENECPAGAWYDINLHSAVAAAHLLRLISEAWGFNAQEQRAKELNDFAAKLGVPTKVEGV